MAASSLLKRTLTSVLLVVVLVGALVLHPLCCAALFAAALAVMINEYYRMALGRGTHTVTRVVAICLAVLAFLAVFMIKYYKVGLHVLLYTFPLFIILLVAVLLDRKERIERLTAPDICFPLVYLLPSMAVSTLLLFDRTGTYNPYLFIAVMVLVWASDVGAYALGMAFGQRERCRKLAPTISPKKSWAGVWGSVLFTLAAAVIIFFLKCFDLQLWYWLVAALIVVVFGILGDLFESLIKRHFGQKDAGCILAGHGGLLDRFDGALFAVPMVTVFFILTSII